MKWRKGGESENISLCLTKGLCYEGTLEVRGWSPTQRSTWQKGLQSQTPEDKQGDRTGEKTDMGKK